jgi:hypothetical protein
MMLVIGFTSMTTLTAALRLRALGRCTSCYPRCPGRHQIEIAGQQGMLFVAIVALVLTLVEKLL